VTNQSDVQFRDQPNQTIQSRVSCLFTSRVVFSAILPVFLGLGQLWESKPLVPLVPCILGPSGLWLDMWGPYQGV
jgi:hypothetical protein